jgi:hypothetical protein
MTWASKLMTLFPLLLAVVSGAVCVAGIDQGSVFCGVLGALAVIYLLPPFIFRVHHAVWGVRPGITDIAPRKYSPWWGGHQIQAIYLAFPALEAALRLVPGVYSLWLRLWGSRIGKRVYWTPLVEIADRNLLEIGDDVIFGHKVACYGHVITPKSPQLLLYQGVTKIGSGSFIGAGSRLGPGTELLPGTRLKALQDVYPDFKKIKNEG